MEVLSIGEKIKRARIYKGYTLKDVCGNKISVSKLSCIENEKITPEDWVLDYIATKLDLDIKYLKQSVEEQIIHNIKEVENNFQNNEYEKKIIYNLNLAQKYGYNDLAFYIMHLVFEYYLDKKMLDKAQQLVGNYYDLCNNSKDADNMFIYYMDLGRLFYKNKEFIQAENYFRNIRKSINKDLDKNYLIYAESVYGEASCNIMLNNYEKACEIGMELIDIVDYIKEDFKKAEIYHMIAMIQLRMHNENFEIYEDKAIAMYGDKYNYKAKAMLDCGSFLYNIEKKDKAIEYINNAIHIFPKDNKEKLVEFMLLCAEKLIYNNVIEESKELIEKTLDCAIETDDIKYIEKAYYLKSKLLQKEEKSISAETYMNLSLDALTKFGTKKEMYSRYMEMGKMYYDIGSIKEALKYFTLAISIEKKL